MGDWYHQFDWNYDNCRPTGCGRGQQISDEEAEEFAKELKEAMDGAGTNEGAIINVLVKNNRAGRKLIREKYASFGADLIDDLKSELSGDLEKAIVGMMMDEVDYDCMVLHDAITGPGTNEADIIGILCPKSNEEIDELREKYKEMFECEMTEDLMSDVGGDVGSFVYSMVEGGRGVEDGDESDEDIANEKALELQEAGRDKWGTDESVFNFILRNASNTRIRKIMKKYEENTGASLLDDIDSEFSGPLRDAFTCILKCACDESSFFVDQLDDAMAGWGTSEDKLIRVLVARSEIDLEDIKDKYAEKNGVSLEERVGGEMGGDAGRCLKSIIRGEYVSDD